jgi:hypothetical protein
VGGERLGAFRVELTLLAAADHEDSESVQARRRDQVDGLARLAREPTAADGAADCARGRLIERTRRWRQPAALERRHRQGAKFAGFGVRRDEFDLHAVAPAEISSASSKVRL